MKTWVIAGVVIVIIAVTVVGVRLYIEAPQATGPDAPAAAPVASQTVQPVDAVTPVAPDNADVADVREDEVPVSSGAPEIEQWQPDPAAVQSLRRSMEEGDPRAPPIARRESEREMPSEDELADPELYLQYETRQQQKVYASFIEASGKKISDLQKMIDRAKAEGGVTPEQLAQGEEKLRRLEEMRDKLLQENPELATPEAADEAAAAE